MGASAPRVGSVRPGAPASTSQSFGSSIKSFASSIGQKAWSVVPTAFGAGGGGNVMTLSPYMLERARENVEYQDIEALMSPIQMATKTIANLVQRAGIQGLTGMHVTDIGDGVAEVVLQKWCCRSGVAEVVLLLLWCCCGGAEGC
jgi:hypothetical protein